MHEALLYTKEKDNAVRCLLCRHNCVINNEKFGICNVRYNKDGVLYSLFYGKPIAMAVDPIEKKPLFHYFPGSSSFSIATTGCNFKCSFCQNWNISQYHPEESEKPASETVLPDKVVKSAIAHKCKSIAYTYTEPTIFFEYALDSAKLAKENSIGNCFVTNGYVSREAIDIISPYLDAANIDLKAFRKDTYRKYMKAQLDGVCDSIKYMKEKGIWIEVTTLIIQGINDDPSELKDLASFLVQIGRDIPWHISRFHPDYEMKKIEPTPIATLKKAYEIGKEAGLRYVYLGNIPSGDNTESTYCYNCSELLIKRSGDVVEQNNVTDKSECPKCKALIDGVGLAGN